MTSLSESACVVGLGNLGAAIALNLADSGWRVHGTDRSPSRLENLGSRIIAVEPDEIRDRFICLVVSDDAAVEELCTGPLTKVRSGSIVIAHSTIQPQTARRCAEELLKHGVRFLDAPVSGGADRARRGELTLMVGGSEEDLCETGDLFNAEATAVIHAGDVGAGSAMKLAHQIALFSTLGGLLEGLQFANRWGVGEGALLDVIGSGLAQSWVSSNLGFYDELFDTYEKAGTAEDVRPWKKDLIGALGAAECGSLPLTEVLERTLTRLLADHAREARQEVV